MAKLAVIRTGGKQYKVSEGQTLKVENLKDVQEGSKVKFETLLFASEDGEVSLGKPSLGEKTEAEVVEHGKGKKVEATKFKNKIRYHKSFGHRQPFTKVKISSIQ